MLRSLRISALLLALLLGLPAVGAAQYFGRNKIQYESFDVYVVETDHFDLHAYRSMDDAAVRDAAVLTERWYGRLSGFFDHRFEERKPLVLYANQPDFQQTNTTPGFISQGTGGFTESLMDRIVLPFAESLGDTDHVLGHELVHAFQFDLARSELEGGPIAFNRLPLWLTEGMAEYLSLGRVSPHTAMWLRDAVLRDDLPTIDDLSDPRYFPYRYGHAFWAWVAGVYGDDRVPALFRLAGQAGLEPAIEELFGVDPDTLSARWIEGTRLHVAPFLAGRTPPREAGEPILEGEDADDWMLAPSLSPDGRRVVFLSERDLFTIDLYVADAATGRVLGKLTTTERNPHFDAIAFLESSGAWSPDGQRFAFVTVAEGDHRIAIADVDERDVVRTLAPPVESIHHLAWSPDGGTLAFSGAAGGFADLYRIDLATGRTERLTEGPHAELQPAWSPDGRTLAFATDRPEPAAADRLQLAPIGLGFLNLATGAVRLERPFGAVKHMNPQYAPDGSLYFISDRGGISDVYRLDPVTGRTFQVTNVATGVSGITELSPALSVAAETGELAYSVFYDGDYLGRTLPPARAAGTPVTGAVETPAPAAILPPVDVEEPALVARYLAAPASAPAAGELATRPYDPELGLEYVAPPSAGVAVDRFGASVGGSIGFFFSDLLGNRQLGLGVQANGGLKDLGGDLIYVNRGGRLNWGGRVGHTVYRSGFIQVQGGTIEGSPARVVRLTLDRTFFTGGSVLAEYPFSMTRRIEGDLGFTRVGFDRDVEEAVIVGNVIVEERTLDGEAPEALNLGTGSLALVTDYSFFGFTSPVRGGRSRFEVGGNAGSLGFGTLLADWRRYLFARPVTLAFRAFHLGRYGGDAESDRLTPLFVGYPTLVRGYEAGSFDPGECSVEPDDPTACPEFDRLTGSRLAVANVELRVPLIGTEEFGLIGGGFLPVEVAAFVDAGGAWTADEGLELALDTETAERVPVVSAGGTLRLNFFGAAVAELYYAYPFHRPDEGWRFGFQLAPGW